MVRLGYFFLRRTVPTANCPTANCSRAVNIVYTHHIVYNIASAYSHAVCVRACAHDTGEVIWQCMAVDSQQSASVHMCVVFVAFNRKWGNCQGGSGVIVRRVGVGILSEGRSGNYPATS